MEASVRNHSLLVAASLAVAAMSSSSLAASSSYIVVDAFAAPRTRAHSFTQRQHRSPSSSSALGVSVGLGPENDNNAPPTKDKDEADATAERKMNLLNTDPYDSDRIIVGEDGAPLPHIVDHEPYRAVRMSDSDRAADAWFASLLDGPDGGEEDSLFLGPVSREHMDRLLSKVELADEPFLRYQDEEWTPYVSRRLPTSPLYPAYGLETYGLPVPRRGAEAWRHFDVNGMIAVDYSSRPEGIGTDIEMEEGAMEATIASLRSKGAWLDDDECEARLVYVNGRFCPGLSVQTDAAKNLDSSHFEAGLPERTLEHLSRLPDGHTDELAAEVPDDSSDGPLTSLAKLSAPDHCVGKATSQFAINNQQGTAAFAALNSVKAGCVAYVEGMDTQATKSEDGTIRLWKTDP